jgi:hypothetical protein
VAVGFGRALTLPNRGGPDVARDPIVPFCSDASWAGSVTA